MESIELSAHHPQLEYERMNYDGKFTAPLYTYYSDYAPSVHFNASMSHHSFANKPYNSWFARLPQSMVA